MTKTCHICKIAPPNSYGSTCKSCHPIASICCTSADEGIRYGIPKANLSELVRALDYERRRTNRTTVVKALVRAIDKAQSTSRSHQ